MMAFLDMYAFWDNSSETEPLDYAKVEIEKDSLQVKTLRELTGTEGTPWAVQAYLTQKMTGLQGEWSIGQREKLADFLSSSYLTTPTSRRK